LLTLLARANNDPQQFAQLIKQLTPDNINALLKQQQQQLQQQQTFNAVVSKTNAQLVAATKAKEIAASNVQRITAARIKLRHV
jgi:glucose-6-phosphate isomerase